MDEEKAKVVTSLRISEKNYDYIKEKAQEIGISQNAFISILIDLGIKLYESDIKTVIHSQHQ